MISICRWHTYMIGLIGTFLVVGSFVLFQTWMHNFHEVIPGELYRSGQFQKGDVKKYVQRYGIHSIINLRGQNPGKTWYDNEVAESQKTGVTHIDFSMSSKQMLTQTQLTQLVEIMRNAPKPVLIHCEGGANRTSFAVAVYLAAISKANEWVAESQMSIRFGNFPEWVGSSSKMSRNFETFENTMGYKGS